MAHKIGSKPAVVGYYDSAKADTNNFLSALEYFYLMLFLIYALLFPKSLFYERYVTGSFQSFAKSRGPLSYVQTVRENIL